jgi:hypothetical protein
MLFGKLRRRTVTERQYGAPVFQPRAEALEAKIVLTIPLGGNAAGTLPGIAQAPFGISDVGTVPSAGAGYSVADVADLVGTGYDSLVIGAPGVTGSPPTTVGTADGTVYVVFGSAYVNSSSATNIQNWLNNASSPTNLANSDRVGNLSETGQVTPPQTNPITSAALNFPFSGVTFDGVPSLGASVAGVTLSSGTNAILIGAPNANGGNGEAFLIYGSFASFAGKTIDLASPGSTPGLNIVTFLNSATYASGGQLGFSVAGGSNILGDGSGDVILGAPKASVAPTNSTTPVPQLTGVTYVISAAVLSGGTQTIDLATQLGSQVIDFAGASSGDEAGYSVADGGNVNGASGNVDDLLIGAPAANGDSGAAYLVYGGSNLANLRTTVNGIPFISLSNVSGGTGTGTTVPGATFVGPTSNAGNTELGFSVAAGGDFNGDGFADILLGGPGYGSGATLAGQGIAYLFYGASSTNGGYLTGSINLNSIPANYSPLILQGGDPGDLAGYSMTQIGVINAGEPTSILIGAPGYNSDSGTAYLIPGRANFSGIFSLATTEGGTTGLQGLQFTNTTPGSAASPPFFGASVSGRLQGTQTNTVDTDNEADFIIGSPGYDYTQTATNVLAGAASIVEGGFLTVPIPAVNTVTTQIGVGTPFAPFSINATTPAALQIYVFGSTTTTPNFMPVTDIDPTTVKVNGVAYPNATLVQDPDSANYLDGIPDAIITISPRSALNLANGTAIITINGQTLASSPLPDYTWTGTATVSVTGGSVTPVVGATGAIATGPVLHTTYVSPFGANQYTPSLSALSALNYQPIPLSVALNEYLPTPGFRARMYLYNHPHAKIKANRGQNQGRASGINTLSNHVFSRGTFHAQKTYTWTHKTAKIGNVSGVIPIQLKREVFRDNLIH